MKFKEGQKVRVKRDLIVDREYNGFLFFGDMEDFLGEEVTIRTNSSQGKLYLIEENNKVWTKDMFEADVQQVIE